MTFRFWPLAAALLLPSLSFAESGCPADETATVILRSDNDLYGRDRQDQGYTNGLAATYVSSDIAAAQAGCQRSPVRWADRALGWLSPDGTEVHNLVFTFTHGIYTPTDGKRSDLILDDRPYAGVALLGAGINSRRGNRLDSTHLRLGMVGPSAQGEMGQDSLHHLFGRERFRGWDHQLRDEVLVQLVHERLWRREFAPNAGAWQWDAIGHAGGSLGNFQTFANAGAEVRFGKDLPNDFGTDPLRPAGENTAPGAGNVIDSRWRWHFFAGLDARWVLHDVTLDGNTWRDSHEVDRRDGIADLSLGIALTHGPWKIAGSHIRRTREFDGQVESPVFGTVSLSRQF